MKKLTLRTLLIVTLMLLVACTTVATKSPESNSDVIGKVLIAIGYSKLRDLPQLTEAQNKLATEQSAKINAYRELAKQLYREQLTDDLMVADQVIKSDSFRVYLDLFLREAKVVSSKAIADQKRVELALNLTPRFYHCFSANVIVVSQCLQEDNKIPFTRIGYQQAATSTVNLSCMDCMSQLSVSGFSREKHVIDRAMLDYGLYDSEWTINMGIKAMLRYLYLSQIVFD